MTESVDLFVIGGGINGCGIARDAAGRGLSVTLAEMNDLASGTSSASTKLFHGGLRYLEYFEVRLVREALEERETLLHAMPHISWPMRFVLPLSPDMRFESTTPASKLLRWVMPWAKGRRPAWMIRLGLFLYDHMGGRKILPPTQTLDLETAPEGKGLESRFKKAFEYSDCWVEDSRLVVLNARDAEALGATILTRTKVVAAERDGSHWRVTLESAGKTRIVHAKMLVNAAGPWVEDVLHKKARVNARDKVRLVRGSHIVVNRVFDHDKAYFFQGSDGRIIFAIPYEQDFTLIGTTDRDHDDPDTRPVCTDAEQDYLLAFINQYLSDDLGREDIVWTYSGVRPLYDDGADTASAATRDYTLVLNRDGAPMLNIFGGKITTYRRLAESALEKIAEVLPVEKPDWTAGVALPGGDFPVDGVAELTAKLQHDYGFLDAAWAGRLIRAYGTEAWAVLGEAKAQSDLGEAFGATLTEAELRWLRDKEYAHSAEDVIWRRSKMGLRLGSEQVVRIEAWMQGA